MKAAALHDHGDALERAAHEVTLVPGRPGLGEARNCGLRNADCGLDRVGYRPKTGAQDDRHARAKAAEPRGNRVRGAADQFRRLVIHSAIRNHSNIPASVADRKFASVPAIMARNPSRARSCLRSGASAPMPPIWMPTELTLANPHSAKVAMVNDTGSSCPRSGPRSLYAMNSFSTMRSPSRLPIVPLSCHGTPMTQAIGRKIQPSTVWMLSGNHVT